MYLEFKMDSEIREMSVTVCELQRAVVPGTVEPATSHSEFVHPPDSQQSILHMPNFPLTANYSVDCAVAERELVVNAVNRECIEESLSNRRIIH